MDVLDKLEAPQTGKSVEDVLTDGYSFEFGNYLGRAFGLFGKEAGYLIGFSVIYLIVTFGSPYFFEFLGIPYGDTVFGLLVVPPLSAGIFAFMKSRNAEYNPDFSSFFFGYRNPFWVRLILATIVQALISLVFFVLVFVPYAISHGTQILDLATQVTKVQDTDAILELMDIITSGEMIIYIIIASIVGLVLNALWIFTPIFILNRNMGFWQAMEASRKIVTKKLLYFMALLLVLAILLFVGVLICVVGLVVAYPVFCLAIYVAYSEIMEEPID